MTNTLTTLNHKLIENNINEEGKEYLITENADSKRFLWVEGVNKGVELLYQGCYFKFSKELL
jgi:hypothetical protein